MLILLTIEYLGLINYCEILIKNVYYINNSWLLGPLKLILLIYFVLFDYNIFPYIILYTEDVYSIINNIYYISILFFLLVDFAYYFIILAKKINLNKFLYNNIIILITIFLFILFGFFIFYVVLLILSIFEILNLKLQNYIDFIKNRGREGQSNTDGDPVVGPSGTPPSGGSGGYSVD